MSHKLGAQTSLTGYLIFKRCLPVVLILSPVVFVSHATDFGCRILHHAKSVFRCGHDVTDDSTLCEQATCPTVPLLSPTSSVDAEPVALSNDRGHQLMSGRPNVHALLRSALEGLGTQCLVVAACGPAELVETVRQTVVIAKQENSCTRLEFCGSSPRW